MLDFSRPSKKEIKEFLERECTEVYDMPCDELEMLMWDNKCVKWYGREWFVPRYDMFGRDEVIYDHLVDNYHV